MNPTCRICLLYPKTETLMPTKSDFIAKVKECTGVLLTEDERIPNKICTSCALLLRAASKLRTMCQQAEEHLKNIKMEEEQKQEQEQQFDGDSENELMVDYTDSYEVTLETDSITGSTDGIIIKPSNPARTAALKSKRRSCTISRVRAAKGDESSKPLATSYVCNICNNVYTEEVKLRKHLKQHSMHKPHECEICHKRFRQTPQLTRHMNSHTGQKPYKCHYCDASFADPSTRIKHQRIHTEERPYTCEYCKTSFAYSNVLKVHLRIHTGERPFSCKYCGRPFSQAHHKNAHERTHMLKKEQGVFY